MGCCCCVNPSSVRQRGTESEERALEDLQPNSGTSAPNQSQPPKTDYQHWALLRPQVAEEVDNFYATYSVPSRSSLSSIFYAPPPRSPPPIEVCSTEQFTPSMLNLKRDVSESTSTSSTSFSFSGPSAAADADESVE
ncbi:hypothetical protein TYRP_014934 [Tyrophagus putrescentiae]|nr:hypothetical protein TYRP_014934 [Tyrophagus putrescentiae]